MSNLNPDGTDKHGRTWRDEMACWCVEGLAGEWISMEMLGDEPPPEARCVRVLGSDVVLRYARGFRRVTLNDH